MKELPFALLREDNMPPKPVYFWTKCTEQLPISNLGFEKFMSIIYYLIYKFTCNINVYIYKRTSITSTLHG